MPKSWTFWAVLALGLALAWLSAAPPQAKKTTAPADQFSAQRAMADVRGMARAPHPTGSAEHARVRDFLLGRLRALGMTTQVLDGADLRDGEQEGVRNFIGANVKNIVGILPGTDRNLPALALMAHYDSVAGSSGAADDASGVAAILETVRAIKARGPAARDIIVLLTDGEEGGLFGAISFWRDQPLARRIGLVVNLEARGSSGPAFMFETGPENAGAMRLYGASAARPEASSLSGWVYDRMPNGTDFTIPKKAGLTGFNIAMIGTPFDYHSASATPRNLDRDSLQHMGDQALALADALARAKAAPERGPDLVYSEVFGRWLIAYPAWGGWLVLLAATGLIAIAMRTQGLPERRLDLAKGAGFLLLTVVFPVLGLHLLQRLLPVGADFYQSPAVAQFSLYFAAFALFGGGAALAILAAFLKGGRRWQVVIFSVVAGLFCSVPGFNFDLVGLVLGLISAALAFAVLGREPVEARAVGQGLLLAGFVLAALLQILAAEIAYLFAWPLLAGAAVAALRGLKGLPPWLRESLAALLAVVGVGWTLRMTGFLFDGLGMSSAGLLGLFAALAALVLAPYAAVSVLNSRWNAGAMAMIVAGLALAATVGFRQPWSARTPAPSHIQHVADAVTGRSLMVSARSQLDPWSKAVLAGGGGTPRWAGLAAIHTDEAWVAAARPIPAPGAPAIVLGREGNLVVLTIPTIGARELRLTLTSTVAASDATLQGRPARALLARANKADRVRWYAPGEGLRIAFRPSGPGSITVGWATLEDEWPAAAKPLPKRPPEVMAAGSSDASLVTGTTTLHW